MRLFIAEKPSLGRAIAENIGSGKKEEGHIILNGGRDIVTWCFGHILEQAAPEDYDQNLKRWSLDTLPIIPNKWQLKVKKDATKQFKHIEELISKADYIVNAGDPDREGQLLVDEVLEYVGNKKPVKRILLNALDEKSVKQALNDLRDNNDFIGLKNSARARSEADWLVGMNLSRAYTLKAQEVGFNGMLSVGRVLTPTMALVVRRETEIKNFKSITHYVTNVNFAHANGIIPTIWKLKSDVEFVDDEGRLLSSSIADGLISKIKAISENSDNAYITKIEQKEQQIGQRLPYSLSTLQVEAGKKYNYTPQQVLNTMQELYEKKLTTYPRSDCEYLPTNQLADASKILTTLIKNNELSFYAGKTDIKIVSRCWNDKKISAHHAIIPTGENPSGLNEIQQRLYNLVARAYIAQFFPIHIYLAKRIIITCADETFISTGKTILQSGWKELYSHEQCKYSNEENTAILPDVSEGDIVHYTNHEIKEQQTKPPKRFTEATLLQAMKEIYKYVKDKNLAGTLKECKGIGTEATRASIIEKLKDIDFVMLDKKYLVPTERAKLAVKILPEIITYPDTTAKWERELDEIVTSDNSLDNFIANQIKYLKSIMNEVKAMQLNMTNDIPKCPNCSKAMKRLKGKKGYFWSCSGYPDCKTTFPDKNGKPNFATQSANTGKTSACPECGGELVQSNGKFGLYWKCKNCKLFFSDANNNPVTEKCPNCKQAYLKRYQSKKDKNKFYYSCSNHDCKTFVNEKDGAPDITAWFIKHS